jgi:hypothetical protein
MPLYFFHLRFGDRIMPDDEGIELRDRMAARDEAFAVVRDLSDRDARSSRQRWASWFLQVADERGDFLRLPIGRPALEVVSAEADRSSPYAPQSMQTEPTAARASEPIGTGAELIDHVAEIRQRRAELLNQNRQLQSELALVFRLSEKVRRHADQVISSSRGATSRSEGMSCWRAAGGGGGGSPSPPLLVVLPGGR